MKNLIIVLFIILIPGFLWAQQNVEIKTWLKVGPQKINMPAFSNIKNVDGESFKESDLLKSTIFTLSAEKIKEGSEIFIADKTYKWTSFTLPADSSVVSGIDSGQIILLASYINIDCWSNPKFKVKTDALVEIYIDSKLEKSKSSSAFEETSFNEKLNNGKHLIVIKLLSSGKQVKLNVKLEFDKSFANCKTETSLSPLRNVTINDVLDGKKISSALISPSGNFLIINIKEVYCGSGTNQSSFELKDLKTGKDILELNNQQISGLKWLPRSDKFSYTLSHDQVTDIYVYDLINAKENLIAKDLKNFSYYLWAPNEENIVYTENIEAPQPGDLKRIYDNDDRIPNYRDRSFLNLIDVKSGNIIKLTSGNLSTNIQDIHPKSNKILFSTYQRDYSEVPFTKQNLYEMDLQTFTLDTIWKNEKYTESAIYSPDGTKLLVSGGPECFNNIGKNVSDNKIPNSYDIQLYLFDLKTRNAKPLTLNFDPSIDNFYWASNNDIYLSVTEKDFDNLYDYNVNTGKFSKNEISTEAIEKIDFAYHQPLAVYFGTKISTPQKLFLINLKTRQNTELLFPEKERFKQVQFGKTEEWNFVNKNNTTIYGQVYYPPNYDKSKKYPVIVNYYGGTTPTMRDFGGRYPRDVWAANGYIVYVLQPSGAIGFGQNFSALHVNGWGLDAIDDIIDGTKKFLESHSSADASNVGCIGASYGGYTTMLLQTRTDIFKTAISHAGISSISSYWGEGYWGYSYSAGATAYSYPWNRKDIYVDNSPLFNADKFKNSILLLHGKSDTNVPVGESLQYYAALKILGKDVEMVLVEGQDHWILDYSKRIKWHYTIMSWFDKKLKGQSQQWEDLYPDKNY
jgi:dipeptidyl aminopeptidase/acylaminoacyl peptidase